MVRTLMKKLQTVAPCARESDKFARKPSSLFEKRLKCDVALQIPQVLREKGPLTAVGIKSALGPGSIPRYKGVVSASVLFLPSDLLICLRALVVAIPPSV